MASTPAVAVAAAEVAAAVELHSLDTGTPGSFRQAFKTSWIYELPFGRGRRWLNNSNGIFERIVGGREFDGTDASSPAGWSISAPFVWST